MTCPLCGAPSDEGALRCPQCGSLLPGAGPDAGALPVYGAASDQPGEPGPEVEVSPRSDGTRWVPIAAAVVVLVLVLGAVAAGRALTDDGHAEARDLSSPRTIHLPAPVERTPSVAWRRPLEVQTMLGVDGTVLVADERGEIVALAAGDGDERWRLRSPGGDRPVAWLSRLGDAVVVAYDEADPSDAIDGDDLQLVSVDARTGRVRWRYDQDDVVFAVPMDHDVISIYRLPSTRVPVAVTFLAADTGRERWTVEGELRGVGRSTVYVTGDGAIAARDLLTGKERWRRNLLNDRHRGVEEVGDTLVLGRDEDTIVGLSVRDGRFLWSRTVPGGVNSIRSTGGRAVAVGAKATGLDPATGEIEWSTDADGWTDDVLLALGGRSGVYAASDRVVRLDPDTGDTIAESDERTRILGLQTYLHPSLADGVWYLTGDTHELVGVDVGSLEPIWSLATGISLDQLAAADGTVLVATGGELVAYR